MFSPLCHDALEVSYEDVIASVEVTHPVGRVGFVNASGCFYPAYSAQPAIEGVDGMSDVAEIGDPVVSRISVDVVDDLWHFVVGKPPRQPVTGVIPPPVSDADVARLVNVSRFCTSPSAAISCQPDEITGFGSVLKLLSKLAGWLHTRMIPQRRGVSIDTIDTYA